MSVSRFGVSLDEELLKALDEFVTDNQFNDVILSVQGFYLNEINYLEIIAVKGPSKRLTEVSEKLIGIKGIEHGKLVMTKAQ
jgi:CopG family nickel-responsive transcriptional regulator